MRADSYSSTGEVVAFSKYLLKGQSAFNSTTRPTGTEVDKFIDRASGHLNVALALVGLVTPITNSTAKLACDDWVTQRAAEYVELTQRGVGYNQEEGSRYSLFGNLRKKADEFAIEYRRGFINLGVTELSGENLSVGLSFTGLSKKSERADPDDSTREQPMVERHQFDNPEAE